MWWVAKEEEEPHLHGIAHGAIGILQHGNEDAAPRTGANAHNAQRIAVSFAQKRTKLLHSVFAKSERRRRVHRGHEGRLGAVARGR